MTRQDKIEKAMLDAVRYLSEVVCDKNCRHVAEQKVAVLRAAIEVKEEEPCPRGDACEVNEHGCTRCGDEPEVQKTEESSKLQPCRYGADKDGCCNLCGSGLMLWSETTEPHECPPGFTENTRPTALAATASYPATPSPLDVVRELEQASNVFLPLHNGLCVRFDERGGLMTPPEACACGANTKRFRSALDAIALALAPGGALAALVNTGASGFWGKLAAQRTKRAEAAEKERDDAIDRERVAQALYTEEQGFRIAVERERDRLNRLVRAGDPTSRSALDTEYLNLQKERDDLKARLAEAEAFISDVHRAAPQILAALAPIFADAAVVGATYGLPQIIGAAREALKANSNLKAKLAEVEKERDAWQMNSEENRDLLTEAARERDNLLAERKRVDEVLHALAYDFRCIADTAQNGIDQVDHNSGKEYYRGSFETIRTAAIKSSDEPEIIAAEKRLKGEK